MLLRIDEIVSGMAGEKRGGPEGNPDEEEEGVRRCALCAGCAR
jgi:hypothetical protein